MSQNKAVVLSFAHPATSMATAPEFNDTIEETTVLLAKSKCCYLKNTVLVTLNVMSRNS